MINFWMQKSDNDLPNCGLNIKK